jgi:hypothetical protein
MQRGAAGAGVLLSLLFCARLVHRHMQTAALQALLGLHCQPDFTVQRQVKDVSEENSLIL